MISPTAEPDAAANLDRLRPKLIRIAYRMLGSVVDAEDVVQDAFIRWHSSDREGVIEPEGYLSRVVTRLSLDVLKSARRQRETYIGPWLPEPVFEDTEDHVEDVTLTLLLALERLSPLQRAVFLLHDIFDVSFEEVAETLGRTPTTCRQLASRARSQIRAARPRFDVSKEQGLRIAQAFFAASRTGDMCALQSLLAVEVRVSADGGGKRPTVLRAIEGLEKVLALHDALARYYPDHPSELVRFGMINGLPGFVTQEADGLLQTTALQIEHGRIIGIFVVRNPDKLRRLADTVARWVAD